MLAALLAGSPVGPLTAQPRPIGQGCNPPINVTDPVAVANHINAVHQAAKQTEYRAPPTVRPVSESARLDLIVDYADVDVSGCAARLRTYNGAIVGPTIRAKPGDTLHIRLINKLPEAMHDHPQKPPPAEHAKHFSFNITNLHTHGLHVAPQGPPPIDPVTGRAAFESDNVLIELKPNEQQDYRIEIAPTHPTGTFWYHAHVHGATSVQVSSGMAGALILEDGTSDNGDLNTVPAIGAARDKEKVMLLQQIWPATNGQIESLRRPRRLTLINGQLVPTIKMQPGEIQRWRFIHGGIEENIALALDEHPLNEVAADGLSMGRSVAWPPAPPSGVAASTALFLAPGYRSDVLIQAKQPEPNKRYFLRQLRLPLVLSIQAVAMAIERAQAGASPEARALPIEPDDLTPGQILAELVIEGQPVQARLPTSAELAGVVPKELTDITDAEIEATRKIDPGAAQTADFAIRNASCDKQTGACQRCPPATQDCGTRFMIDSHQFSMGHNKRTLKLNTGGRPTVAEWRVTASADVAPLLAPHPFHIHVNPFQASRLEPDDTGALTRRWIWKDTIFIHTPDLPPLRMRYTKFKGKFVIHCHILDHEDKGMMQLVEIVD